MWCFLFMVGSMAHVMSMGDMVLEMCGHRKDSGDMEAAIERLVPFIAAGIHAAAGRAGAGR